MPKLPAPSHLQKIPWCKVLPTLLALTLLLTTSLAILIALHARETIDNNLARFMNEQQMHMNLAETLLQHELERRSKDLLSFTGTPVILHFFASPSDQTARQLVNAGLNNFITHRDDYDQARIFDTAGQELIRVEKRDQQTKTIPPEELGAKSPATFLNKVLQLQHQGRIAGAPMELSRDRGGEIVRPLHPLFHLGTPIFDLHNHKVGVLLLTCRGQQFLDLFARATIHPHDPGELFNNNPQILSQEGYWLLAPDKEDEWGFVRDPQRRFDRRFPEIWRTMRKQGGGQIKTADGLFTFTTVSLVVGDSREGSSIYPAEADTEAAQEADPAWILLLQTSPEELALLNSKTRHFHLILFLVIVACSLPLLLWITLLLRKDQENKEHLRQSEERLRGITDSVQDAILMIDPSGAISFWNPAAEKIFGYRAEEVLGQNLHSLLAPARYHAAQQTAFSKFLLSGHGNAIGKTIALSALRKDGREIPVTLSLSAVFQGKKWHAVGILRDMTEHKLMEGQMLQAEKMSTIAGLAAGVAHEINTPLSAILQSIQVIRQSLSPDLARNQEIAGLYSLDLTKVQEYFEKRDINFFMDGIRDSAIKSGRIINTLLQFSRLQKGENSREDLALLLDKAVKLAKNDYDLHKKYDILDVEIVKDYSPNLPPVSCVAIDIEQVFINLLKNAVQAMADRPEPRPKGRLILRTRLHGEMVRVEIEDNGPGMDEATLDHAFDPFFTTKDIGVGTGLGLSVSYTIIVTKHEGHLTAQSVPGQGTTMTIDLPLNHERQ